MTQITLSARGGSPDQNVANLRAILGAIHASALLDEASVQTHKVGDDQGGEVIEMITFNGASIPQCDRASARHEARGSIFKEINAERSYQTDKWGVEADDTKNTPWMWASYIGQYATKWMTGLFTVPGSSADLFRTCMIKTASIAVAAVESLDRQRARFGKAFYETLEEAN